MDCKGCGLSFSAISKRSQYCSVECRNNFYYKKQKLEKLKNITIKTCLHCQKKFSHGRSDRLYCSVRCGNRSRCAKWEAQNPDKVKEHRKNTRVRSWVRYAISRIKSKAKKQGIPFNIEICDIEQPVYCSVLGIKLNYHSEGTGYKPDTASIDRIDPKKGYTKGNVRVISARANLLKSDASIEELEAVLLDLKTLQNL